MEYYCAWSPADYINICTELPPLSAKPTLNSARIGIVVIRGFRNGCIGRRCAAPAINDPGFRFAKSRASTGGRLGC